MTSSSASTSRTCPVCGARNSGISLFCAECGSSLNTDANLDRTGETASIPIPTSASQHTEPFTVARDETSDGQVWRETRDQRHDDTAPFRPTPVTDRWNTSSNGAGTSGVPLDLPEQDDRPIPVAMVERRAVGARGFFLGLLAFLLITVILGLYGWSAWISADLRDTISGWFGGIG